MIAEFAVDVVVEGVHAVFVMDADTKLVGRQSYAGYVCSRRKSAGKGCGNLAVTRCRTRE